MAGPRRALAALALLFAAASCTTPPAPPPGLPGPPSAAAAGRCRARDLGLHVGALRAGPHDAITDVPGVRVGHCTLRDGQATNTGVTVILPPGDNPFRDKLPAALAVQNGFGKLIGATQLQELGELESPIALCGTLNVHRVADGLLDWLLALPGNERVRSANVVVGETNDGRLSDVRARPVTGAHVAAAIAAAAGGDVPVGAVGAGAGTVCCGWKGGIGTSSRCVGEHVLGVLVQTNFGGDLRIDGEPAAALLPPGSPSGDHGGSCLIVIATDAPLDAAGLRRLATRAFAGMARAGASFAHGSGDYAIAFSTTGRNVEALRGELLSPLFAAVADATEQAILDSLCAAVDTTGMGRTVRALPLDGLRARAPHRGFRS
ncbi:MAG: P1 family peptidase [Planctomycetes bacterium]|nr:P1 family peptidase [Planctomycetota bacterium]